MTMLHSNAHQLIKQATKHGALIYADAGKVRVKGASKLPTPLLEQLKEKRDDVLAVLTLPRLPWQLERLVKAAINDALRDVSVRGVADTKERVKAYALEYFTGGDKAESLKQLWEVYALWQAN
jgi:hypothetical protein